MSGNILICGKSDNSVGYFSNRVGLLSPAHKDLYRILDLCTEDQDGETVRIIRIRNADRFLDEPVPENIWNNIGLMGIWDRVVHQFVYRQIVQEFDVSDDGVPRTVRRHSSEWISSVAGLDEMLVVNTTYSFTMNWRN